ncbi:MAG: aminoglycoside phosphotransferase family protein [Opitutaceae bacterium]|nr:aminoglycoside phosphotransferase family protein [Opitutaceae bacterium]
MNSPATVTVAARLLEEAGFGRVPFTLEPLPGGRNNRVARLVTAAGAEALLKCYFHHPRDPRDRLATESAFLRHLERCGARLAPRLYTTDAASHTALLEYIHGTPFRLATIDAADVDQAAEFFRQANAARASDAARAIPVASEACFSIVEHLENTGRRVDRLGGLLIEDDLDRDAHALVRDELIPQWREIQASLLARWPNPDLRRAPLAPAERCLSPSDFGFHNALREADGHIRFLDFEYAGWDDPAKLICDFANQPDLLLPRALSQRFRDAVLALQPAPEALRQRAEALDPLYQVKWACICLNDFLPAGRTRHHFTAGAAADHRTRRAAQLDRARQMLALATAASSAPEISTALPWTTP